MSRKWGEGLDLDPVHVIANRFMREGDHKIGSCLVFRIEQADSRVYTRRARPPIFVSSAVKDGPSL